MPRPQPPSGVRILLLAPRWPQPPLRGDQIRVHGLLGALRRHAEVRLLAFGAGPLPFDDVVATPVARSPAGTAAENLRRPDPRLPGQVRLYLDASMRAAVDRELAGHPPDVVHLTLARMAPYLPPPGRWHRHLDLVDALSLNIARRADASRPPMRQALRREARLLARYEARAAAAADTASLVAESDRVAADGLEGCAVVPNGVDPDAFPYRSPERRPPTLIFFGNLGYFPNIEPARFTAHEVLPRVRRVVPEARLIVVGARPAAAVRRLGERTGVEVVGPVPRMVDQLHQAAVALVPMFTGSGMKNKVVEAMSAGTPVVANPTGVEGIGGLRGGEHCLVAEGADALAACCVELLRDADRRVSLAEAGRALVEQRFSWDARARQLLSLYGR